MMRKHQAVVKRPPEGVQPAPWQRLPNERHYPPGYDYYQGDYGGYGSYAGYDGYASYDGYAGYGGYDGYAGYAGNVVLSDNSASEENV